MTWLYTIGKNLVILGLILAIFSYFMVYFEYICIYTILGFIIGLVLFAIGVRCILKDLGYLNNDNNNGGSLFLPINMLNALNTAKIPLMI